jgi:hypothetical protein
MTERRDFLLGLLVACCAIAGWIVLWGVAGAIGLQVGQWLVGPGGLDGYLAMTGIVGGCGVTPLALVIGFFKLLAKGRMVRFLLSGMLVGFAITLWPVLTWPLDLAFRLWGRIVWNQP